ncbi:MAG: hypothetical protein ACRDQB_09765 [Thermocrispum sp.]
MEVINQAPAERAAAQAEPANLPAETAAYPAEIYAVIDSLGDVGSALADGMTVSLAVLYDDRRYEHEEAGAYVAARSPVRTRHELPVGEARPAVTEIGACMGRWPRAGPAPTGSREGC